MELNSVMVWAMRTIHDLIKAAGGAKAVQEASDGAISRDAVYKWPSIGIPDRHWELIIRLAGASPDELYQANLMARATGDVA